MVNDNVAIYVYGNALSMCYHSVNIDHIPLS